MTNAKLDTPDLVILKACLDMERDTDSLRRVTGFQSVASARLRAVLLIKAGLLERRLKPRELGKYRDSHRVTKYMYRTTPAGRKKLEELGEV